ncbi:MAG: hypothetical protein HFG24_05510 [Anaerotruncus sp.]|nr:hypothetical protein [Anaerotruncus sp.]
MLAGEWLPERGIHACIFMLACEPSPGSAADLKKLGKSLDVSLILGIYFMHIFLNDDHLFRQYLQLCLLKKEHTFVFEGFVLR